jgi:hypothetical protein
LAFWSFVWSLVSGLCVSVQSQKAGGARYVQKKTLKPMSGILIRPYLSSKTTGTGRGRYQGPQTPQ